MQITINKPIKELNHLLLQNDEQPTPKRSTSHTRGHLKEVQKQAIKENQPLISNVACRQTHSISKKIPNETEESIRNKSRPKSRKTMGPVPSFRACQNHEDEFGCFNIQIEGQRLYYCEKCAKKLKNQGFPIKKQQQSSIRSIREKNEETGTSFSHLQGHPQFKELKILLSEIYNVQEIIEASQKNKKQIQQLFNLKIQEIQQFYEKVEQFICESRQEGINSLLKLKNEWINIDRNSYQEQNESNWKQTLKAMQLDIEGNIEDIVGEVDEQTFNICVENYRQRLSLIISKTQQSNVNSEEVRFNVHQLYDEGIHLFETEITQIKQSISQQDQLNVVTSKCDTHHDSSHKKLINGPFRNLFNCETSKPRKTLINRK